MKDDLTLSCCNLYAVLKDIEYLVKIDKESEEIIKFKNISIQFNVFKGPKAVLSFKDGKATLKKGKGKGKGKASIKLFFTSPKHFNKMIDGSAMPIPYCGFSKIGFLTNQFIKLSKKLEFYLKPTPEKLKGSAFFEANTIMTFYTAFLSIAEIGNFDELGKINAKHIPNGFIQCSIGNEYGVYLEAKDGVLTATKGFVDNPTAVLKFSDIETAQSILSGGDTYVAIASGKLLMKGLIPMVENLNPILDLVNEYLG